MSEGLKTDLVLSPEIRSVKVLTGVDSVDSIKHPGINGDDYFLGTNNSFGLFDGMSGKADPEEASATMSKVVSSGLKFIDPNKTTESQVKDTLTIVVQQANQEIKKGSGSTGTFGIIIPENDHFLAIINATGDSPVFLYQDRTKTLTRQTQDHNGLCENCSGNLDLYYKIQSHLDSDKERKTLKPDEKVFATFSNRLSQYFGKENLKPSLYSIPLNPGDILFVFTDGVSANLTPEEIASIIRQNQNSNLDNICSQIVQSAVKKGQLGTSYYKNDDTTAIAIKPYH